MIILIIDSTNQMSYCISRQLVLTRSIISWKKSRLIVLDTWPIDSYLRVERRYLVSKNFGIS